MGRRLEKVLSIPSKTNNLPSLRSTKASKYSNHLGVAYPYAVCIVLYLRPVSVRRYGMHPAARDDRPRSRFCGRANLVEYRGQDRRTGPSLHPHPPQPAGNPEQAIHPSRSPTLIAPSEQVLRMVRQLCRPSAGGDQSRASA